MIRGQPRLSLLPSELRDLVKWSGAALGDVIKKEVGSQLFQIIERLRDQMANLRDRGERETLAVLEKQLARLRGLDAKERLTVARAFTLLLEIMNACENAYRSHRLVFHTGGAKPSGPRPEAIIYVLTSHPTEARSPRNIAIFRAIERTLIQALKRNSPRPQLERQLFHQLELAWRIEIVRERTPQVRDEAEHIYSILFEPKILQSLLDVSHDLTPVYIRTWAGGDKDGHPGVDESVMLESLSLSRQSLLGFIARSLAEARETLDLLPGFRLKRECSRLARRLAPLKELKSGDGARIKRLRGELRRFSEKYREEIGASHPSLLRIVRALGIFPGLVVPLELRESSDILMAPPSRGALPIERMLATLGRISRGGDPRWYARGFIVSMTGAIEHLEAAARRVRQVFGSCRIPVIPLFEEVPSLMNSAAIVRQMIKRFQRDIRENWNRQLEIMVGYSDSAKESGVLPSRLAIASCMNALDRECQRAKVQAVFFQGSGGSVDRGGGTVQDQTAWWPRSALRIYKVTVQGEMVERSFATPEITRSQFERIFAATSAALARPAIEPHLAVVRKFSDLVARTYEETIARPEFWQIVGHATPYAHLSELKLGSRPAKRAGPLAELSVKSLRAIPWVLCWTQTRVLFPTWWGVGAAWKQMSSQDRIRLRAAFAREPVFATFVRALGFTLAKVELPIWKIYLRESGLAREQIDEIEGRFDEEYRAATAFLKSISRSTNPLWFRPWLGESIRLRSPMIHPLNLLQILALQENDVHLLRLTVTGTSSGMLTTG